MGMGGALAAAFLRDVAQVVMCSLREQVLCEAAAALGREVSGTHER